MKIIAVASGKGGVGKSTVSLGLARALAARGADVGLLDADVYGPDIPLMLGLKQTRDLRRWALGRNPEFGRLRLEPVEALGLKVMSVGFLVSERQSFALPAQLTTHVWKQFVDDVDWGELAYLVVDLPPGTADLQQHVFKAGELAGALIVLGPQDAAHLDARKLLDTLREARVPVLGAVENMSGLRCPHCGEVVEVFPPVAPERSLIREVELLASIPLDPSFARVNGVAPVFAELADRVVEHLAA
ncbi:MAG TPA: P-loop NTPase [Gaiellaceae bacterium]|nr:P-loop NTPase [Gaiellaceae bacterium]